MASSGSSLGRRVWVEMKAAFAVAKPQLKSWLRIYRFGDLDLGVPKVGPAWIPRPLKVIVLYLSVVGLAWVGVAVFARPSGLSAVLDQASLSDCHDELNAYADGHDDHGGIRYPRDFAGAVVRADCRLKTGDLDLGKAERTRLVGLSRTLGRGVLVVQFEREKSVASEAPAMLLEVAQRKIGELETKERLSLAEARVFHETRSRHAEEAERRVRVRGCTRAVGPGCRSLREEARHRQKLRAEARKARSGLQARYDLGVKTDKALTQAVATGRYEGGGCAGIQETEGVFVDPVVGLRSPACLRFGPLIAAAAVSPAENAAMFLWVDARAVAERYGVEPRDARLAVRQWALRFSFDASGEASPDG